MSTTYRNPECTAFAVGQALRAHEAGVVVTVERSFGETMFVIWAIGTDGKITSHQLNAHCTDEARLTAHVQGFIENHLHAFAAVAA